MFTRLSFSATSTPRLASWLPYLTSGGLSVGFSQFVIVSRFVLCDVDTSFASASA